MVGESAIPPPPRYSISQSHVWICIGHNSCRGNPSWISSQTLSSSILMTETHRAEALPNPKATISLSLSRSPQSKCEG